MSGVQIPPPLPTYYLIKFEINMSFLFKKKINNIKKTILFYFIKFFFRKISYFQLKKLVENNISNKKKTNKVIIEGFWDNAHQWLRLLMLINALNHSKKTELIGIYSRLLKPFFQQEALKIFNLQKIYNIDSKIDKKFIIKSNEYLRHIKSTKEFINLKIDYNFPLFYLYDDILRQESIGCFDDVLKSNDLSFQIIIKKYKLNLYLAKTLSLLDFYSIILKSNKINLTIISHQVNTKFACLAWISLKNKIPVYVLNYYNKHISIRKLTSEINMIKYFDDAPNLTDLNRLSDLQKQKASEFGQTYLSLIRKGKESQVQIAKPYGNGKKFYRDKEKFMKTHNLSENKLNVVIMGNVWPDYPNGYSAGMFTDYVDWYLFTLQNIVKIKDYNWLLKSHPGEHLYGNKTTLKKLTNIDLPKNVVFWNEKANGNDLLEYCDLIVTARGTSAIEYAALGKKVVTSFDSPFTKLGFTTHAKDKKEYQDILKNINKIKKLSQEQVQLSKIFAASFLADIKKDNYLEFPYGTAGNLLYIDLFNFIKKNRTKIKSETSNLVDWLNSDSIKYNTYKFLNFYSDI